MASNDLTLTSFSPRVIDGSHVSSCDLYNNCRQFTFLYYLIYVILLFFYLTRTYEYVFFKYIYIFCMYGTRVHACIVYACKRVYTRMYGIGVYACIVYSCICGMHIYLYTCICILISLYMIYKRACAYI